MAELELENPQQADAPVDGLASMLADAPFMQAELVALELWRLRREMFADPGAVKINIGAGQPQEQTIQGNRQDPYNGVVIYNPTPATLSIGFEAGTALLAPVTVPPFTAASFPERFANLSVALLTPGDQQTAIATPVTILRTRIPPAPFAAPFGGNSPPAQPLQSITNAAAVGMGAIRDNGYPRATHSLIAVASGAVTAGQIALMLSHDGVNFWNATNTGAITGPGVWVAPYNANFPARYTAAMITTAIVGGTVSATVASA